MALDNSGAVGGGVAGFRVGLGWVVSAGMVALAYDGVRAMVIVGLL